MNYSMKKKRIMSMLVVLAMAMSFILPINVFAETPSEISSNITEKVFVCGATTPVEYTVSTVPNDDKDTIVKGAYSINDADAIETFEYYETYPGMEGWYPFASTVSGTFGPIDGFPMMEATSTFRLKFKKAGNFDVTFSIVKVDGGDVLCTKTEKITVLDYSKLDAVITEAGLLTEADYTATSFGVLKAKVQAASEINRSTNKSQSTIDNAENEIKEAITNLVLYKEVNYIAVAVADDANTNYAKATKIEVVFAEPVNATASDVLNQLSLKDSIDSAAWKDSAQTILELVLKSDATLTNGTALAYSKTESILTKTGYAIKDNTTNVVGNLEDTSAKVTATSMAATIVNKDAKPGADDGDKIVLVFNAPIKDSPASITVTTDGGDDLTANVVSGTANTVYEIVLTTETAEDVTDSTKLTYSSIENVALNGTFGTVVAPKALSALAVNVDGTAKTKGDQIVIIFDKPTNGATTLTSLTALGTDASAVWSENNTKLTITIGSDATVANGGTIDISSMGIKDEYSLIAATNTSLTIGGSFGTAVAPKITRILAVDNNGNSTTKGDNIVVTFDRPTNGVDLNSRKLSVPGIIKNSSYGLGEDYVSSWNTEKTELTIVIGEYATLTDGLKINFGELGIKDKEELADYVGEDIVINGSFGTTVTPKITRSIAFTQNGKHIIRTFFNTLVSEKGAVSVYIVGFEDDNATGKWTHNGISYYDLTLGANHDEFKTNIYSIKFDGELTDTETEKSSAIDATAIISGGFEKDIEPEILSLTAYSQDGSGVAKKGDKIILVSNTEITSFDSSIGKFEKVDSVTWAYTLKSDNELAIGGSVILSNIKANNVNYGMKSVNIAGSFGYKADLKLLSLTAYNGKGNGLVKDGEIIVSFSVPVTDVVAAPVLGNEPEKYDAEGYIWKIKGLKSDVEDNIGKSITFTVTNVATGEETQSVSGKLTGSFGYKITPEVVKATAYSKDGSGIAKAGDTVIVTFNTPVEKNSMLLDTKLGTGATASTDDNQNYVITLGTNPTVKTTDKLTFKVTSIITGEEKTIENVALAGSFGVKISPEIVSATAYSQDGSGVAKKNDVVIVVFNTPVNMTISSSFGTAAKEDTYGNVWKITLANNSGALIGKDISVSATSIATGESKTLTKALGGSFGKVVEPELLSATAYSKDGSGIAKVGDKIILVFNDCVSGVTSNIGTVSNIGNNTIWEITLTSTNVTVGQELSFNVTSIINGSNKEVKKNLGGSFGKVVEPKILSVTAISNDGSGVAKVGDKLVVVFDTEVRVEKDDATATYTYEYFLTDSDVSTNKYAIGNTFSVDVWTVATAKKYTLNSTVAGSYGYETSPVVKSVVLKEDNLKEIITIVFDLATNKVDGKDGTIYENNKFLGQALKSVWLNETTLKITLGDDATVDENSKLNLSGLGIKAKSTGKEINNLESLAITGSLIPVVKSATVVGKVVKIVFSARTNQSTTAINEILNQKAYFGSEVQAMWENNGRELRILMSDDNTMADEAYINLNALGIKDAFSGNFEVVGQYKICTKELEKKTLEIISVFVKANNTDNEPREDFTKAIAGDEIYVRFADTTNYVFDNDAKANISLVNAGETFGDDYEAKWVDSKTIKVVLGANTNVTTSSKVKIKDVCFANGTGYLAAGETNAIEKELTGQFDGRTYWIVNPAKNDVNGRVRVVGTVNKADITNPAVLTPFVVCQAMTSKDVVLSINALKLSDASTNDVVFDFDATNLAKIKMFVLNGDYADPNAVVSVFSETIEK